MFAATASNVACCFPRRPARSTIQAVAVPEAIPADNPDRTRPTSSAVKPWANRNVTALAADRQRAAAITGRRPISSDRYPKKSSVATTPNA